MAAASDVLKRRVITATIIGALIGVSCWLGGVFLLGYDYTSLQVSNIVLHRAVMGFVIGGSAWRMNWALHGVVVGSIVGVLFILFDILSGYPLWIAVLQLGVNAFYGFTIELVNTKLLRLRTVSFGGVV